MGGRRCAAADEQLLPREDEWLLELVEPHDRCRTCMVAIRDHAEIVSAAHHIRPRPAAIAFDGRIRNRERRRDRGGSGEKNRGPRCDASRRLRRLYLWIVG